MSAPTLLPVEPVEVETPSTPACLPRAEEHICPMTGTTTCTPDESKQRQCPSC